MLIYIITFLILLIFSFLELRSNLTQEQHRAMAFFVFCLLVFQVGLRWQTGTDWDSYLLHFEEINTVADVFNSITGFEQGYSFFVLAVKSIWNSYTGFLMAHALVYYILVFSAFKKLTPYFFISITLFYATNMGVLGANRQLVALGVCLFALRYVLDRSYIKFFLCIGFAFFFHSTAIMFAIYYFLHRDIQRFWIFAILIVSFIIGKTGLPFFLFSFLGDNIGGMGSAKVLYYTERYQEDSELYRLGVMGLVKRLVFIGLFIYNYEYLTTKLSYYKLIFNGYFVGLIIYFLFSSSILVLVNRGGLYFATMEVLLLASQFLLLKDKNHKVGMLIIIFLASIFLFYQSLANYADLFIPYKGIFINSDFHRYRLD